MPIDTIIKKRIKKLKDAFPDLDENELERELIPLPREDVKLKKKVKQ